MPDISCISPDLRDDLQALLRKSGASRRDIALLDEIPECEVGVIKIRKGRGGGKRAPSQYNLFIGECMAGGKKDLKSCAGEWREQKGKK